MLGLSFGIAAMYGLGGFDYVGPSLWSLFFIGPVATAVFLIVEGLYALSANDNESENGADS